MIGLENPLHLAIILIVVLMVFGAKRLPEMGKSLGTGLRGFKDVAQRRRALSPASWPSTPRPSSCPSAEHDATPAQAA